jgi:hypothetical protein
MRLVRVTKGVEKALIGALLVASSIAWAFLYNYVVEDNPQPKQLQPSAQFMGGDSRVATDHSPMGPEVLSIGHARQPRREHPLHT